MPCVVQPQDDLAVLGAALALLRTADPRLSPDPGDYDVLSFGVLAEVFPGTGDAHNVSFAGSIDDLMLSALTSPFVRGAP